MRALPRCRASEEAADIGIYNKREDSLCGCFVAVKLSEFGTELMVSDFQMAKKTKHPNVNFEIQNYGLG